MAKKKSKPTPSAGVRDRDRSHARDNAKQRADARRRARWLWMGLGIAVATAALIAVLASSGSNNAKTASGIEQTRDVQVTGTPLAAFATGADPAVGQAIPEVHGAGFDGSPIAITRDGKAKVLVFVAHWCPHCQKEVPVLAAYLPTHPMPADVELVTVSTSTSPDRPNYPPSAWLADEHWPGPTIADSSTATAATAYGLTSLPYFVAVDKNGNVVARTSGEITTDQFDALVRGASSGTTSS